MRPTNPPTPIVADPQSGRRDYLSYSAIALYQACPLRYHFKYIAGLPEETVASSLVFGSAFHAAVQCHYEHLLTEDHSPSLDSLLQVFWDDWNARDPAAIQFNQGEDLSSVGRQAERMLLAFQSSDLARPQGVILGVEEELRGPIVPHVPDILARIDLLIEREDHLLLVDFKTARSRWGPTRVAEAAPQLLLYGQLAQTLASGKPLRLGFAVVTKAKQPVCELHPVALDASAIERTKAVIQAVWQAIEHGQFLAQPSPRHCPQCPFRRHCYAVAAPSA